MPPSAHGTDPVRRPSPRGKNMESRSHRFQCSRRGFEPGGTADLYFLPRTSFDARPEPSSASRGRSSGPGPYPLSSWRRRGGTCGPNPRHPGPRLAMSGRGRPTPRLPHRTRRWRPSSSRSLHRRNRRWTPPRTWGRGSP